MVSETAPPTSDVSRKKERRLRGIFFAVSPPSQGRPRELTAKFCHFSIPRLTCVNLAAFAIAALS